MWDGGIRKGGRGDDRDTWGSGAWVDGGKSSQEKMAQASMQTIKNTSAYTSLGIDGAFNHTALGAAVQCLNLVVFTPLIQ